MISESQNSKLKSQNYRSARWHANKNFKNVVISIFQILFKSFKDK